MAEISLSLNIKQVIMVPSSSNERYLKLSVLILEQINHYTLSSIQNSEIRYVQNTIKLLNGKDPTIDKSHLNSFSNKTRRIFPKPDDKNCKSQLEKAAKKVKTALKLTKIKTLKLKRKHMPLVEYVLLLSYQMYCIEKIQLETQTLKQIDETKTIEATCNQHPLHSVNKDLALEKKALLYNLFKNKHLIFQEERHKFMVVDGQM